MSDVERKAWITGAGGLIGSHLAACAREFAPDWDVSPLTRASVDLANFSAVDQLFQAQQPDLIIHCAAMSRSPDCQKNPTGAHLQNVEVTRVLSDLANAIPLVFMSTDLVFDGRKGGYVETDSVNPMSVYAESKLKAEEIVLANPKHLVVRTSLNAGESPTGDRGMDEQLMRAWNQGIAMSLFDDEYRCPIPASATARAIWDLINANSSGIMHVAGAERLSRWQIGKCLTEQYPEFKGLIARGSLREFEGAPRSPDTSLDCTKAQSIIGFDLPKFSEWVKNEIRGIN